MNLFEEIKEVISKQLNVDSKELTLETSFVNDLGVDSLNSIELVMELEEKFNLEIPDEDAGEMNTIGDVVKYIASKINMDSEIPE